MKAAISTFVFLGCLAVLGTGALEAQTISWGDSGANGQRESATTAPTNPGWMALDGEEGTSWRLITGSASGWLEVFWATPRVVPGVVIEGTIPEGVILTVSVMRQDHWVAVPGARIEGPADDSLSLDFPDTLGTTNRYLVTLEGAKASEAEIREIRVAERSPLAPFVKIRPKSYIFNQEEYINLKPERLWDGIADNPWFEPLWDPPSGLDGGNNPHGLVPPYRGNPPRGAEITWQLDGTYEIQILKAKFFRQHRRLRVEFWVGGSWVSAQTFGDGWQDRGWNGNSRALDPNGAEWRRIDLTQPVSTDRIRITFPGGWENARDIGELEVWGKGWPDAPVRSLVMPPVGNDRTRLFTVEDVNPAGCILEVLTEGTNPDSVTGDWNGNAFSMQPSTWLNGQTVYRQRIDEDWLRKGTQFLRVQNAQSVLGVTLSESLGNGQIDLGWPYSDGMVEGTQAGPDGTMPSLTSKTWDLGTDYILEHVRVYSKRAAALSMKTGLRERNRIEWTPVEWTSQGEGWWEASLRGVLADAITLESSQEVQVDEIQLSGSNLADTKVGTEKWWPSDDQLRTALNDDQSVIGWTGSSDVQVTIRGRSPRMSGKLFWIPVRELDLDPDGDSNIDLRASRGTASYSKKIHVRWSQNPPVVIDQGQDLLVTTDDSFQVSGTVKNVRSRVFIDGTEVQKSGKGFSTARPLRDGYQKITVEVWDEHKRNLLASWSKEIYKARDLPMLVLDQPYGDVTSQSGTYTLAGRVGSGVGLTLSVGETPVPLSANQFTYPVALKEGPQILLFTLTDGLGATTKLELSLGRDSTAPVVRIIKPSAGQYLTQSSVDFTASAGETGLWWKINDEPWQLDPSDPHVTTYVLADGFYHYEVVAQDRSGNVSGKVAVDFVVDVTRPVEFPLTADVSGWTSNRTPEVTFQTTDATSGIDHYEYSIDTGDWATATSPLTLPSLADGVHNVFVKALDKAGNVRIASVTVYTDATAPQAFEATANVSGWTPNSHPTVTFATIDATSGVDRYEVQVDSGAWTTRLSPFEASVFSDGVHTIGIRALDRAGNTSAAPVITVFIDATAPEAFQAEVDVSGWTPNNRPTFTFGTTDATSGIDRYEVKADDGAWATQDSPYQVPALTDGAHTVGIRAIDLAGNTTNAGLITVLIDTTPPVAVQDFRLIPGKDRMDVLWTTPDDDIVVYHVARTEDSVSTSFDVTTTGISEQGLGPGTVLEFQIQPQDKAGNLGSWVSAEAEIVGMAVKAIPPASTEPMVVEFQNIKMAVAPESLPPEVKAVLINEVDSEGLEEQSTNPIIGPIYSFTTLQDDGSGNLVETTHTEFQNEVLVILNYDESLLPNGFAESNLGVYFYDTLWSRWFRVEKAAIDIEQNRIIFLTNHFTNFSIQPTLLEDLKPQELKDAGHSPYKSESSAGEVTVSPQGGTMMTEVSEFTLQGKNGFSFPVKRIYDSQTARIDSPSMNLSMSLGINFGPSLPAAIAGQLISAGVGLVTDTVLSKIAGMFQKNGDYPLALGIGWRLNFPYVMATDTRVMVRLPDGGYYPISQMELDGEAPLVSGVRSLTFENHRGEDFTFKVHQVRGDISSAISGLSAAGVGKIKAALVDVLLETQHSGGGTPSISLIASFIPGWITFSSELITKDGTSYVFDSLGRVVSIRDPSSTNVITFEYNGFVLQDHRPHGERDQFPVRRWRGLGSVPAAQHHPDRDDRIRGADPELSLRV